MLGGYSATSSTTLRRERVYSPPTTLTPTQIGAKDRAWKVAATRRCPNDARRVVWAFGEYYYFFLRVFFDTNQYFIVNIGCNLRNSRREDS